MTAAPVAFGRSSTGKKIGQPLRAGSEPLPKICAAAEDNYGANRGKYRDDLREVHSMADANRIERQCNGSDIVKLSEIGDANGAILMPFPSLPKKTPALFRAGNSSGFDAARGWNTLG